MYLWRSLRGATRGSIIFDTATGEILGAATWGPTSGGLHMEAAASKLHEGCGQDYLAMLQDTPLPFVSNPRVVHTRTQINTHTHTQLGFRICGKGFRGPTAAAQRLWKEFLGSAFASAERANFGCCSSAFAFAERAYRGVPLSRHNGCGKGFWGICSSAFASAERANLGVGFGMGGVRAQDRLARKGGGYLQIEPTSRSWASWRPPKQLVHKACGFLEPFLVVI